MGGARGATATDSSAERSWVLRRRSDGRALGKCFGRQVRSRSRWFAEFCNSHYVSHFAALFIVTRAKISVCRELYSPCCKPRPGDVGRGRTEGRGAATLSATRTRRTSSYALRLAVPREAARRAKSNHFPCYGERSPHPRHARRHPHTPAPLEKRGGRGGGPRAGPGDEG
jgi:hypothetical protein